jgi:hypothetical protein
MKATRIHAVKMVRRIRDAQAKLLARKSPGEIIAFFRAAGVAAMEDAGRKASTKPRKRRAG